MTLKSGILQKFFEVVQIFLKQYKQPWWDYL